jgi:hypothetical protein
LLLLVYPLRKGLETRAAKSSWTRNVTAVEASEVSRVS